MAQNVGWTVVFDGGVVTLGDLLMLCWWMMAEEYGPIRISLSSVEVIDMVLVLDASCRSSVKEMICGRWAVTI